MAVHWTCEVVLIDCAVNRLGTVLLGSFVATHGLHFNVSLLRRWVSFAALVLGASCLEVCGHTALGTRQLTLLKLGLALDERQASCCRGKPAIVSYSTSRDCVLVGMSFSSKHIAASAHRHCLLRLRVPLSLYRCIVASLFGGASHAYL